jgi:molybdopterin/thiamine biosynthesis adenylyltransferase
MGGEHPLTRQICLAEIGSEGQARIAAATLEVRGRDGSLAELVYLHRAGVESVALRADRQAAAFAHAQLFRHAASRRFAAGAWRALSQIRAILAINSDTR